MKRVTLAAAVLLASVQAHAAADCSVALSVCVGDTLTGTPTSVHDADTIRLGGIPVRFADLDAPEVSAPFSRADSPYRSGQPYGPEARDALAGMIDGREVVATVTAIDRDDDRRRAGTIAARDRAVARITVDGRSVQHALVDGGWAWVYPRYNTDPELPALQERARADGLGLWAEADPVAPWTWRTCARRRQSTCP